LLGVFLAQIRPAQKKRAGMNFEFEAFGNFKRDIFEFMHPDTLRPRTQNSYLLFSFAPVFYEIRGLWKYQTRYF